MSNLDLAVADDVLQYLASGPFASDEAVRLAGGYGNYTYRIKLRNEYRGRKTLVLKHGKASLPGTASIQFALYRQNFEQVAMRQVHDLVPDDSVATVPEVYLYDENAHVIIMDDCGEDSVTLKDLFRGGTPLPVETARKIGVALGAFLARLHTWGQGNAQALDFYDGNKQARTLSAWATYGRLVSTLSGQDTDVPALADPPLGIVPDKLALIGKIAQETTVAVQTARETVVMGDFWPGNVLLSLVQKDGAMDVVRIFVIDWELVKPGLRGMDIGQFCGEMQQMRRFYPETEQSVFEVMSAFLGTYKDASNTDMTRVAKIALTHIGAHMVAWTPRIDWGGKEATREVVLEGVQYLLDGYEGGQETIENSVIGRLTVA